MWNEFNESGGRDLPGFQKKKKHTHKQDNRGWLPILREEHTQFLVNYIDSNAASTVDLAYDELCKAFPGLEISVNAVYKAEILREEHDPDTTIRKRKLYIEKCKENNVNYQKNRVFVDEEGFNLHIMRNRA
ncbi:hypothetical protein RO3G_14754 [Rhizopus delemar RA 99-880]|uniref:Tc1-like transposase DDE domain-containing protein n=1 Tax=Rhizopus delemar (strain RA 99-880 / ATCC MYA-4621 / FGSC 9543 / NRRL 43880) TaxID=246409 RepID=I1CNL3_RHIO9|nr:hypothetical protein RO3G_14754 [Rhizopus delemar RA 99-880]|eukprot:EIE90043.1 hypothetical protein RO3G_14754 [Rhizopus delemar RA 99-880]